MVRLLLSAVDRSIGLDQGDVSESLLEPLALELERLVGRPLVVVEAEVVSWPFG
jgi:hypothetical protein